MRRFVDISTQLDHSVFGQGLANCWVSGGSADFSAVFRAIRETGINGLNTEFSLTFRQSNMEWRNWQVPWSRSQRIPAPSVFDMKVTAPKVTAFRRFGANQSGSISEMKIMQPPFRFNVCPPGPATILGRGFGDSRQLATPFEAGDILAG
jgi:hypothetical protein